jgi:hypothetical protein
MQETPSLDPERRRIVLLVQVSLLSSIAIFGVTSVFVIFGPEPFEVTGGLTNGYTGLSEVRDTWVIAGWTAIGTTAVVLLFTRIGGVLVNAVGRYLKPLTLVLGVVAGGVLTISFFVDVDPSITGNIPTLTRLEIIVGLITALALLLHLHFQPSLVRATQLWLFVVFGTVVLLNLWQSPATVRDMDHFPYTANELAASGVGRLPLSDFVPQYSSLLGLPISPLLTWFPSHSIAIVLYWLICLQVVCLLVPTVCLAKAVDSRLAFPTFFICSVLSITGDPKLMLSSMTYFAGTPMRMVLPILLLSVLSWHFSSRNQSSRTIVGLLSIGSIGGLTALNNFEFGVPALLAAVFTVSLMSDSFRQILKSVSLVALASGTVFMLYGLIGVVSNKPIQWGHWVLFSKIFGSSGFMKMPMAWGGLHVGFASLCVFGLAIAIHLRRKNSSVKTVRDYALTTYLTYTSVWMLLTFAYFGGRSFTSTLIGGHALQFGMVLSGVLAFTLLEHKSLLGLVNGQRSVLAAISLLVCVPLVFASALTMRLPSPSTVLRQIADSGTYFPRLDELAAQTSSLAGSPQDVGQLVELSHHIELRTGMPSLLAYNHPAYLVLSEEFQRVQCDFLSSQKERYVIESSNWTIMSSAYCSSLLAPVVLEIKGEMQSIRIEPK